MRYSPVRGRGLHVGYAGVDVVRDLDFDLPAKHVSAILGPGGSGKSTLLRALAGEAARTPGFEMRGQLSLPTEHPCFLFQKLERGDSTVADLLRDRRCGGRGCRWAGREAGPEDAVADDLGMFLDRFWQAFPEAAQALRAVLKSPTRNLACGLLRLAAVTATLSHGAPFLLLDEPTADMDEAAESWVVGKIREIGSRSTLVMITRNLRVARRAADYTAILENGQMLESGPTRTLFELPRSDRVRHFVRMGC